MKNKVFSNASIQRALLIILTVTLMVGMVGKPAQAQQQYPAPVISGLSPVEIDTRKTSEVTISGKYFVDGAKISLSPATGTNISGVKWLTSDKIMASVVVAANAPTGARDVTITNPDKQSYTAKAALSVKPAQVPPSPPNLPSPIITAVSPREVEAGQTVELSISGKNFTEGAKLSFNPSTGISVNIRNGNTGLINAGISVDKDASPGTRDVIVINPDGQSYLAKGAFLVKAAQAPQTPPALPQPIPPAPAKVSPSIPVEQIIKANGLPRYHVKIESIPGNIILEGEIDEAKQSLYLKITASAKNSAADFYIVEGQGYGRSGTSKWLKTQAPAQFPSYLAGALKTLSGEIASVKEEGQLWNVEIQTKNTPALLEDYITRFYRSYSAATSDTEIDKVLKLLPGLTSELQTSVNLWISKKDYRIQRLAIQAGTSQARAEMTCIFSDSRSKISLPGEALKASNQPVPPGLLMLRMPSIQGWLESTHRLMAQKSIGLIESTDYSNGKYAEIYHSAWGSTEPSTVPTASNHPLLIGVHNEDNTETRPAFYDTWLINANSYFKNGYYRDYHHFGGLDLGLAYEVIFELRGCPETTVDGRYYPARDWGYGGERINRSLNGMTFIEAIKQYDRNTDGGRRNAYLMLGHVLHLFQDQANSDHARLVAHAGSSMTEGEALERFYIFEIWLAQALFLAGPDPLSLFIAYLSTVIAYNAWAAAGADDVGYEYLVGKSWNSQIETRIGDRIRSVDTRDNYDTYFRDMAELSVSEATRRGLHSPLGMGPMPAIFILGVYAPIIDPDIDVTNDGQTRSYLELTDDVAVPAITMGAGLLEHFYEIVNPPPIVSSVMVVEGGSETPSLFDRGSATYGEIRYHAHWIDRFPFLSRWLHTMKYVSSRSFQVERDEPVRAGKQAYIFVELGPTIFPEYGKVAEEIELMAGGARIPLGLRRTDTGKPYYLGTLPTVNCGEREIRLPLEITARDKSAHLESRTQKGYELDSDPATVARTAVFDGGTPADPLRNYEPGTDRHYQIRFAPARWRIDVTPSNTDRLPVRIPEAHTVTLSVQSVVESIPAPGAAPVEMWLPGTSCAVRWELDTKVIRISGGSTEEGTAAGYHFSKLLLTNPGEPISQLIIQASPETPVGRYNIAVRYTVGTRAGSTPIIFEIVR